MSDEQFRRPSGGRHTATGGGEPSPAEPPIRPRRGIPEEPVAAPEETSRFARPAPEPTTGGPQPGATGGRPASGEPATAVTASVQQPDAPRATAGGATARPGGGARGPQRGFGAEERQRQGMSLRVPVAVATAAVVLLAAGGIWERSRHHETAPGTAASPVASGSQATSDASASPSQTLPTADQVPGPGTVAGVLTHLKGQGFTCEQEDQPGIDSWVCTRYTANPAMMAYVGGATGKRLGRVALNVQDGPGGNDPTARALQAWMAQQVFGSQQDAEKVLRQVRQGSDDAYATTVQGPVMARGSGDGSIVMSVDGWVPNRAMPAHLLPASPVPQAFTSLGFSCKGTDKVQCTRSTGAVSTTVDYTVAEREVSYLKVKSEGEGASFAAAAAKQVREVSAVFQQHAQLDAWLDQHAKNAAGATGFSKGYSIDWYPGSSQQGGSSAVFYVRESCWTDTVESC